jgi:DNA-directed RNA polymerase specialized sigma24 family protein
LIRVTSHKCFRWRRNEARSAVDSHWCNQDEAVPPHVDSLGCEELYREQLLREAVSELPDRCKHLVRMLFFTAPPVPYEQAARILGLATGSVGFIRMRCLERLRRILEKKGFQ